MSKYSARLAFVLALSAAACNQTGPDTSRLDEQLEEFAVARTFVTASLKDPESARFGPLSHGKGSSICGSVNAKNGFGGYTGMAAFVYSPGKAGDELYIYEFYGPYGDWDERGRLARIFEERGCTVGPDHQRALAAIEAIEESNRRLRSLGE